jgi:CTP synthase
MFCDVRENAIIESVNVNNIYEIPLSFQKQGLDDYVLHKLNIQAPVADMTEWQAMIDRANNLEHRVKIVIVGKYVQLHDAYLSVSESLKHAGYAANSDIDIRWVNSEYLCEENLLEELGEVDGILVPGGFGGRGIEGKIMAAKYARENKIPYFGICLGMQIAVIEFARNVCGLEGANSVEWEETTKHPVIHLMPDQSGVVNLGGTLRLGNWPCKLIDGTKTKEVYKVDSVLERHRHRYEVNNKYRQTMEEHGAIFSGLSPDDYLVEITELKDHPWFVGCQFHPEFKSRPNRAHPLFAGFVQAAVDNKSK